MRITGGRLRGRVLSGRVPAGVRPTGSRVREALFAVLGQDLSGLEVLDVFAGTGLLSFESVSRGADRAVLIERSRKNAAGIRASAKQLGVEDRIEVVVGSSPGAVPRAGRFDLVLMDPPYGEDPFPHLLAVAPVAGWRVVAELPDRVDAPLVPGLELLQVRAYGGTRLALYTVRSD